MIYSQNFFFLQLLLASYAQNIDMIRDYFLFKKVSRVVGFMCDHVENSYQIVRQLNAVGISTSMKSVRSNIDIIQFLTTDYWRLGIFVDLHCLPPDELNTESIFDKASAHYMYGHLHNWLILGKNLNNTIKALNDTKFSITTDFVISLPLGNGKYDLYDVYNHCKLCGGSLTVTKFGTWQKNDGLTISLLEGKFTRRWNFQGISIKIGGIVTRKPNDTALTEYLMTKNEMVQDNWPKFGYSIMIHVAVMFNMTFEYIAVNYWPKNDTNGPLINGFKQGLFDLGYYPSILTQDRFNYASVITQIWPTRSCFMFLTRPSAKMDMFIIIRPFEASVWYMIAFILIITVLILSTILKLESATDYDRGIPTLVIVAALCQQGLPAFIEKPASRIAFLQIMIFSLLLFNYYSAAIVSSRLNAPLHKMNDSLIALAKSGLKLASEDTNLFRFLIRNPSDDMKYFKEHWKATAGPKKFCSLTEGLKRIVNDGYAYNVDPNLIYPAIERSFNNEMICQLTEVHALKPVVAAMWSIHNSQTSEIVKIGLLRIDSAGIQKRQVAHWTARKPYCDEKNKIVTSVTLRECGPIILVLVFGILLSIILCLAENFVFWMSRSKQQNILSTQKFKTAIQKKIILRTKI